MRASNFLRSLAALRTCLNEAWWPRSAVVLAPLTRPLAVQHVVQRAAHRTRSKLAIDTAMTSAAVLVVDVPGSKSVQLDLATLRKLEPAVLATHAPAIVAKLKDSDGVVRRAAVETLGKLDPATLAPDVIERMQSLR